MKTTIALTLLDEIERLRTFSTGYNERKHELHEQAKEALNGRITELEIKVEAETAIVDSVWRALGISSYEQARPYTISEHVTRCKERIAKLEAALRSYRETHKELMAGKSHGATCIDDECGDTRCALCEQYDKEQSNG